MDIKTSVGISIYPEGVAECFVAGEAGILPGMYLELHSDMKVYKYDEAGSLKGAKMFAVEDFAAGMSFDDAYDIGSAVCTRIFRSGDKAMVRVYSVPSDLAVGNVLLPEPAPHAGFLLGVAAGTGYNDQAIAMNEEPMATGDLERRVMVTIV